jgi:hypothetical protein
MIYGDERDTAYGSYTALSRQRPSFDELDEYEGTYSPLADLDDIYFDDIFGTSGLGFIGDECE